MGCIQSTDTYRSNYDPFTAKVTTAPAKEQTTLKSLGGTPQQEQPVSKIVLPPERARPVSTMKSNEEDLLEFSSVYNEGEQIGYGTFATVFIGTNKISGKIYAIKKIDQSKMSWGNRNTLSDEISNLREVQAGPNIVQLYEEYYEKGTYCYLVLEMMDGGELFDRIIEKKMFSEQEAREVTKCILDALAYIHSKRVVHRDLKPENLLLLNKESCTDIKLADFGFSKKIIIFNACRTLCGTPGYLAPEILERWPAYDTKCDLWSVGVILFLLLGGYLPFEDEDEDKVFERTRNGMYEFHPHYWGGVSEEAKELVTKFLTINPSKRFSAQHALSHKYMVTVNEQAFRQQSVDVERLKASLITSRKRKFKAAVHAVVVADKLQVLSDNFNNYLKRKRAVESTFQQKLSVRPNTKSHTVDSATGMPFGDFYLLGELLGEGGFASVFQATHKTTHERHACKIVVHSKLPSGAQGALKDEIESLKLLRGGPHIVRLHDVFETPDTTYVIMEELKGGELLQRIVEKEVYTEREARQTVKNLFEAIGHCHKMRIAHRDIKPENLLLVGKGDDTCIKIADFGFAKKVSKINCLTTLCGTPAYVAPEILDLRSKGYDERVDLWSCGVVTYILLGGYAPFEGPVEELANAILRGEYEFHDDYWSSISTGAMKLIASLLRVNPDRRITAEEALQSEWMAIDEETLTIKDLSMAQERIKRSPVEKVRGVVKAIVGASKLTSLRNSFKCGLDTSGSIKRNIDRQGFQNCMANSCIGFDIDHNEPLDEDSSSGKPFDELYTFGAHLGTGISSIMVEATHIQSNKSYAIKCVRSEDLYHGDAVALQDEISALKALSECPYIVKLNDVFNEVDNTFLVLERMEGSDLIDRMIEKVHYTENDAREVCKQLLFGVKFCHSKRIANRNLILENILLVSKKSDIDVKISNFSFAKKVIYPNSLRTQCGTEDYVAPEILKHRPAYDVECDMWSLGVIIYILLGGYRPFQGTPDKVRMKICYGDYEFHDQYWNHINLDAKDLIKRMLTVDPEKRISATDALQHAWIVAEKGTVDNTNQTKFKEANPKAKLRHLTKLIIATNKLQSLGTRYRALQDF